MTFLFALGPTVHVLGRPLFPGPWRILTEVPVFSSMRGLFRWEQWYGLAIAACVVMVPAFWPAAPDLADRLQGLLDDMASGLGYAGAVQVKAEPALGPLHSYATVRRYMKAVGNDNWVNYAVHGGRWQVADCHAPIGGESSTAESPTVAP